jgi:hypothetical protein
MVGTGQNAIRPQNNKLKNKKTLKTKSSGQQKHKNLARFYAKTGN